MPHTDVPLEGLQGLLVEDLAHQTQVLKYDNLVAIADGDTGSFLTTVLQRIEAVVRQLRDVLPRRPYTEYATFFPGIGFASVIEWAQQLFCLCLVHLAFNVCHYPDFTSRLALTQRDGEGSHSHTSKSKQRKMLRDGGSASSGGIGVRTNKIFLPHNQAQPR